MTTKTAPAPLPAHEDRFEEFYIRYDTLGEEGAYWGIRAKVWRVWKWTDDGRPIFDGSIRPRFDPMDIKPLCEFETGFDGCSHIFISMGLRGSRHLGA